ncbi:MAG: ribbon-helix-helix protein, CopG family [Pseudonocardiaceae bacterium]
MSTITFRAGPEVDRALAELAADTGQDRSAAIRQAILDAWRTHRAERLRAEAAALAADPDDRAEILAVREEMDGLRAW